MHRQKYTLAIFDFDGTLANSYPWFVQAFNGLADEFGLVPVAPAQFEAMRDLDAAQILVRLGVPLWRVPLMAQRLRAQMAADIEAISLFEGVAPALHALADAGVGLAVASSNAWGNVAQVLGPALVARVGWHECGASLFGKSARLKTLLRRSGVAARAALFVGDELRDAQAARRAGLAFAAVGWGYQRAEVLRADAPDWFFGTPAAMCVPWLPPEPDLARVI